LIHKDTLEIKPEAGIFISYANEKSSLLVLRKGKTFVVPNFLEKVSHNRMVELKFFSSSSPNTNSSFYITTKVGDVTYSWGKFEGKDRDYLQIDNLNLDFNIQNGRKTIIISENSKMNKILFKYGLPK
jgi:hypothetical protein